MNTTILYDRLEHIKNTIQRKKESNFYLSFSGGLDSTVLHFLVDFAIPSNTIPRVFIDTGIEYNDIKNFVQKLAAKDNRIIIIQPKQRIGQVFKNYGYPFKSKLHSQLVSRFQNRIEPNLPKYMKKYISGAYGGKLCPKVLRYQFKDKNIIPISDECCNVLKKKPINEWAKKHKKSISILGIRYSEGGIRTLAYEGCYLKKNNKLIKYMPLYPITNEWLNWFIQEYNIPLCKLYKEPYNYDRTGCKGCPFAINIQNELDKAYLYLGKEYYDIINLWRPVYDEYIRLNYRLKEYSHIKGVQLSFNDL